MDPMDPDGTGPESEEEKQTLAAQAAAAAEADQTADADPQYTLELGDMPPTLAKLIPRGMAVEVKYQLTGKEIGGTGGLVDPNKSGQLIVSYVPEDYKARPVRENGAVVRWKVIVVLRPTFVVPAESEAGRQALLGLHAEKASA